MLDPINHKGGVRPMKHVNHNQADRLLLSERLIRQSADRHVARLCAEPVRDIRERREAYEKMITMIRHAKDFAEANPGKIGLVIGTGYYVAHDGEKFIVRKGAEKVFMKSITMVAMCFDPLQFLSGHLEPQ